MEYRLVCIKAGPGLKVGKVYVGKRPAYSVLLFVGGRPFWTGEKMGFLENHVDNWFVDEKQWLRDRAFERLGI